MDDSIIALSKKLRRKIEENLRKGDINNLIKVAYVLDIRVQKQLMEWTVENMDK